MEPLNQQTATIVATIIFTAGILYQRILSVEKKVVQIDTLNEKIARLETEVKNLKAKYQ